MSGLSFKKTALYDLHCELGGKMVPFAGYEMPVQYPAGIMQEHHHTRASAGLFDVSHMGQAYVHGIGGADPALSLEKIMPGLLNRLKPGAMKYSLLLNDEGGIMDDLMITRTHDASSTLYIVVNAATKEQDYTRLEQALGDEITLEPMEDHSLLALQGPKAVDVLAELAPDVKNLGFMQATSVTLEGVVTWVSRSGYTGEDGFEISIPAVRAEAFARRLLADDRVLPIGLGARDSLRLEAGLCLSGHDFDQNRDPVEAGLTFALSKLRRDRQDFCGADRINKTLKDGPQQVRVGLKPEGRAPVREGAEIIAQEGGEPIGIITSGGFAPTVGAPIAMGYVPKHLADIGTEVYISLRGRAIKAVVSKMPFVQQNYVRKV